ncbi:MAG: NAD-glutamate dehydrogenase [Actinobacteria bacterium]|nr:NAD-glutamate dehydrogenase [Actinomycetota bacterium]
MNDRVTARFTALVDPADIANFSTDELADLIGGLRSTAGNRIPGSPNVKELRTQLGFDVLHITTDDMPFLVDSIVTALERMGRSIVVLFHPQFVVRRGNDGELVEICSEDADDPLPSGALTESWITVVLERDYSDHPSNVVDAIHAVLVSVRQTVVDWPAMRGRAHVIASDLRAAPPTGVSLDDASEAADLLDWLLDDHLTFLGYRQYELRGVDGEDVLDPVPGSGLGLLHQYEPAPSTSFSSLPPVVRAKARETELLVLTKSNARSPVHRSTHMDYFGIKIFDSAGAVAGEHRFLGLLTSSANAASIRETPVIRRRAEAVANALNVTAASHYGRDLENFLETYPRDELFATSDDELVVIASGVLQMQNRRQTRLFTRSDAYGRFVTCLVYLPRDRYTTQVRMKISDVLQGEIGGVSVDFTARVTESPTARLDYVVRLPQGSTVPTIKYSELESKVAAVTRSWWDDFCAIAVRDIPEGEVGEFLRAFEGAFPESYKEDYSPAAGVRDARTIFGLVDGRLDLELADSGGAQDRTSHFRIIALGRPMSLTRVLPMLQHLGVEVRDEHPYEIECNDDRLAAILNFGLEALPTPFPKAETLPARFRAAFRAAWDGRSDSDALNGLIIKGGLEWREVVVLRAYVRHLRQGSLPFGLDYLERALLQHPAICALLIELFHARMRPSGGDTRETHAVLKDIASALDAVQSLDDDRILRCVLEQIQATLRTNFYSQDFGGRARVAFGLKMNPRDLAHLPAPRPMFEMWVYSPRVEGVHLRFGLVARGGLRWSDRPEDFRTEVLGLVKAQEVKNAIIVPVGAKGGFLAKRLPDPLVDRDAWMEEGRAAYREFVSALLSMTDNLVDGEVVPPADVLRHDGDDPYLVVAADKGTATFSDLANSIAAEYGFWLGDAFASGGSHGYDHKRMGITARGAWESVKRHFREMEVNTQTQDFTVVGIGDMSGDVFGNGMLLSPHIRLVAAFDHRDIFIDPKPDPIASIAERQRLFELPRSTWQDYGSTVISEGGGVYSRSAKSIDLSVEARQILGIEHSDPMVPTDVIRAILAAPVDLLWNGGVGTYVRSRLESDADVGDKSNDSIRICGHELRCRVVAEGGNLGFTQLGRIEAARAGVRLNTDAIDNSAGVDTSDHEVNLKILLDGEVRAGRLDQEERNVLLQLMTADVAELVLDDNYRQNLTLGNARAQAPGLLAVHQRFIRQLEREQVLNRRLERLPDDEQIAALRAGGLGLSGPELAVLLAYSKISLTAALNASAIADDPWFGSVLERYFPSLCVEKFGPRLVEHPLRRSIISTVACNDLLNLGGISFVFLVMEESGATAEEAVRAASVAMSVFEIPQLRTAINELDNLVPTATQVALHLELRRMLERSTRWFLQTRGGSLNVGQQISDFAPLVQTYRDRVVAALRGNEALRLQGNIDAFMDGGAPEPLSRRIASLLDVYTLLDIRDLCVRTGETPDSAIELYFALSERFVVDRMLLMITALPRDDHWSSQARQALRVDLYGVLAALTESVSRSTSTQFTCDERIDLWEAEHASGIARTRLTLNQVVDQGPDIATLSVALRVLRNLVSQTATSNAPR